MNKAYEETEHCNPAVGFEMGGISYYAYYRREEQWVVVFQAMQGQSIPEEQTTSSLCHDLDGWDVIQTLNIPYSEWKLIQRNPELLAVHFV